ncbi:unnamed protein product [Caenorhabditis bovis]|uniref:Anti-proliferative protein domain-containing protein n=1 Tax=Caenorhabditis bovis TaxID=2654633 RepID=A0A8S1F5X0_9PELO|nr:unnamed protein product [Caenorhabditis bovis]
MYTEIKEIVNFIARYIFGHEPRRATGIFSAELGNFLVTQFAETWDVSDPKKGEKERVINIKCPNEGTCRFFQTAALEAGLDYEAVLKNLPPNCRIFANPGEVYFRASDNGVNVPIWGGDVNADENYQPIPEHSVVSAACEAEKNSNLGAAGKPVLIGRQPLPTNDRTVVEMINGWYVPLVLEEYTDLNANLQAVYRYRFAFKPHSSQTLTGLEFSQTRFGSSKPRPDLQTMVNIKQMATSQKKGHLNSIDESTSSRSSSPTRDNYFSTFY